MFENSMKSQANDNLIRSRACPNCYLCGTPGELLYQGLRDRLFGVPGEWNLKKCLNSECCLVWLDPIPVEKDLGKAYQAYYTHHGNPAKSRDSGLKGLFKSGLRVAYNLVLSATFVQKERNRRNVMYLDEVVPGKLLEVGCGDGSRLARMRQLGWEVEGQEVDNSAAEHARSAHDLKVHLGVLEKTRFPSNTFDAIILNHVIEHVFDPIALLVECRRILKPKGILVAITPNIKSLGHRHFTSSWIGLDPPRHLHLFSPQTLGRTAKNAGFNECETWTTAAKAGIIAVGSLDIEREGHHEMGEVTGVATGISAVLYQFWAYLAYIMDRGSGEECVLLVTKQHKEKVSLAKK